jgi:hypothetical protein
MLQEDATGTGVGTGVHFPTAISRDERPILHVYKVRSCSFGLSIVAAWIYSGSGVQEEEVDGGINPCLNPSLPEPCRLRAFTHVREVQKPSPWHSSILIDTAVESDLPQSMYYCRHQYFQVLTMIDWKEPLSYMSILARKSRSSAKISRR